MRRKKQLFKIKPRGHTIVACPLVLCTVYIVGLQKNNVFAIHKQEQIIEARKSLVGALIAYLTNLQLRKESGIDKDSVHIHYENGW